MITVFPPKKAPEADHALHLCRHLADHGVEMHVIAQKGCVIPSHPRITVYPVMRKWSWSELSNLVRYAKRCSPDAIMLVYIGWIYAHQPMITFAPAILKRFLPNVSFVTLLEDAEGSCPSLTSLPARAIRKTLAQWLGPMGVDYEFGTLLRDSDRLIVVSDRVRAALAERFSGANNKSTVIPSPPIMRVLSDDDGALRREKRISLELKEDEFLFAYFGYIYSGKGVETLLRAFQIVNGQRRPVRLILIGGHLGPPAYFKKIQALSKELGVADKIIWTGEYVSSSDEPTRCLHATDICVLPFDKGVCIHNSSFAAAAAHGLPIITTEGPGMEPLFIHESNVFLCAPEDPETLAEAMEALMANAALRHRLSNGVRTLAQEWFSWKKATERSVYVLKG